MTDPKLDTAIEQLWGEIEKQAKYIGELESDMVDLELELTDATAELDGMYAQVDELRYQQEKENSDARA